LIGPSYSATKRSVTARLKAAGRFESGSGTIFLDRWATTRDIQIALLRVRKNVKSSASVQANRFVDVRIVAATHRDLSAAAAEEDFAKISCIAQCSAIKMPSLRNGNTTFRVGDISLVAWK